MCANNVFKKTSRRKSEKHHNANKEGELTKKCQSLQAVVVLWVLLFLCRFLLSADFFPPRQTMSCLDGSA